MDYYLLGKLPVIEPINDLSKAVKPKMPNNANTKLTNNASAPIVDAQEEHYD